MEKKIKMSINSKNSSYYIKVSFSSADEMIRFLSEQKDKEKQIVSMQAQIVKLQALTKRIDFKNTTADQVAAFLREFVDYVVQLKHGQKFGVGEAHIQRFIDEKVEF